MDWIPKPSQAPLHHAWNRDFFILLRNSCTLHFGKDTCYNCHTTDTDTPWECSCESFTERNMAGDICIKHRHLDPYCPYHTKEHYFGPATTT